ncbi:MAG TPA: hypothetical protein VGO60_07015 [Iamia sp.]|jgi:hypothetical protein|nr:hypothetical protein [Iamia sp.]
MTHRSRALVGALTLATALAVSGTPADAAGDKAPPCPSGANIIVSNAKFVTGTECDDIVIPGPAVGTIKTLGGDDVVDFDGPAVACDGCTAVTISVDLGPGDDRLAVQRPTRILADGQAGKDVLQADWMVDIGWMSGGADDDRVWTRSPWVSIAGDRGDDRLDVAAVTPPGPHQWDAFDQQLIGGPGDDVVSTLGARGPRHRLIWEGMGDDTYLLRHSQRAGGTDRFHADTNANLDPASGVDSATLDPGDIATVDALGHLESFTVAWG